MSDLKDYYQRLSQAGYRLTPQRQMILNAIVHAGGHISAEEVLEAVNRDYPCIDLSTVYRTIELLSETGMVTEVNLDDGRRRFHSVNEGHHHHLVCQKCKKVSDINEDVLSALKEQLLDDYRFEVDLNHQVFWGRCAECRLAENSHQP
jgi:Fur family ferric uptake transcriptional regulator